MLVKSCFILLTNARASSIPLFTTILIGKEPFYIKKVDDVDAIQASDRWLDR